MEKRLPILLALLIACLPGLALANMAKWWHEGEGYGPLVPQKDTEVRVDSEDLSFVVAPSLDRASVTATYKMTNGGAAASSAEVAFVLLAAENAPPEREIPRASITIDEAPVTFRVVTEADVLAPLLDAWLVAHPEVEPELARLTGAGQAQPRYADYESLRRVGPGCTGECTDLLRWYRRQKSPSKHDTDADHGRIVAAAAETAIPAEVTKLYKGWSTLSNRPRLSWLAFQLDFAAGATRTVTVRYEHSSGSDARRAVNETFTYDYLLSPAKRWARFGPLRISIELPPNVDLDSALPLRHEGSTHRAELPGLPDQELTFQVMSTKGLLFGMKTPTGYWLILLAAITSVTLFLAARLGRAWVRAGTRAGVVLRCIFATGALVTLANGLVTALLCAAFPERSLGFGYGPIFAIPFVLFVAAVAGMIASGVAAKRAARVS